MGRQALPAFGILAGGLVHAVLPAGAFGAHDRIVRPIVVGLVSGATAVLIFVLAE